MPRIFINYRRDDTASVAGRLYDHLAREFGDDCVFRDIYSISPGSDFAKAIDDTLKSCEVCLVLIGSRWLVQAEATGRPRIEDPLDFVRREIEAALASGLRVVPVLVERATLPPAQTLPESLRPLVKRQALELLDSRWEYDIGRLIEALTLPVEDVSGAGVSIDSRSRWKWTQRAVLARGLVAANLTALVALGLELTVPLTPWSALAASAVGHMPAILGIATALAAVALFVVRGARERPTQGAMRVLRRVQTWSERRSTLPLLLGSFLAWSAAVWAVPEGVTMRERTGPVPGDFCGRFFVDSHAQSNRIQQCPGDRNVGACGAAAFSCQYYEVQVFAGILPGSLLEASVTISGIGRDGDTERPASVAWADGALENANSSWVFSWDDVDRELKVGPPQKVPRLFKILATRQHNPNTPLARVEIRVTIATDTSATPFSRTDHFEVREQ